MKTCLFILLACTACLVPVYALRCYSCSYTNILPTENAFCNVEFDAMASGAAGSIVDCDNGICGKSSGEFLGLTGVERICDQNKTLAECTNDCGSLQGVAISGCEHCCDTDLCNGACSVTFDLLAAAAMLVLSRAFTL